MRSLPVLFGIALAIPVLHVYAQSRSDKRTAERIRAEVGFLACDSLQGRRTGTEGEQKAATHIEANYIQMGIGPYKGQYRYPFHYTHGKEVTASSAILIHGKVLKIDDDAFPLPFSGTGHVSGEPLPDVMEAGTPWLVDLYTEQSEADDPHFDWERAMYKRSKEAAEHGAQAIIFYDGYGSKYEPYFDGMSEYEKANIPVVFVTYNAYKKYMSSVDPDLANSSIAVDINVSVCRSERTGINIAAYIDNKAPYTVIIGAHYDHLGLGEDGNSLYTAKEKQVHHGADDNASGSAALIEIARQIKHSKLHTYNYLFVNFSGEELGLLGSKAFVKDEQIDSTQIAYMINMDMVGRFNDSTHALYVGGIGTSPAWSIVLNDTKHFKYVVDSSGVGPSDHSSFYHAGIPVLFYFTGTHKDYHRPTDVSEKLNYNGEVKILKQVYRVVRTMERYPKPVFTATRQNGIGKVNFKVTLGILPDYSYTDQGLRVDSLSDDKPARSAGVQEGDIILQLGTYPVQGMQTYMEALTKFSPGDTVNVVIKRKDKIVKMPVTFTAK